MSYSYLVRKKSERVAEIQEGQPQKSSQSAGKNKEKIKQPNLSEGPLEVAAVQENGQSRSQTAQQSCPVQGQNQWRNNSTPMIPNSGDSAQMGQNRWSKRPTGPAPPQPGWHGNSGRPPGLPRNFTVGAQIAIQTPAAYPISQQPQDLSKRPPGPPKEPLCHHCQQPGHIILECREIACFKCGEQEHMASRCIGEARTNFACYRCALQGVVFKNCPKCNPLEQTAGNEAAGKS